MDGVTEKLRELAEDVGIELRMLGACSSYEMRDFLSGLCRTAGNALGALAEEMAKARNDEAADQLKFVAEARERASALAGAFVKALSDREPDQTIRVSVAFIEQVINDLVFLVSDLSRLEPLRQSNGSKS